MHHVLFGTLPSLAIPASPFLSLSSSHASFVLVTTSCFSSATSFARSTSSIGCHSSSLDTAAGVGDPLHRISTTSCTLTRAGINQSPLPLCTAYHRSGAIVEVQCSVGGRLVWFLHNSLCTPQLVFLPHPHISSFCGTPSTSFHCYHHHPASPSPRRYQTTYPALLCLSTLISSSSYLLTFQHLGVPQQHTRSQKERPTCSPLPPSV